MTIVKDNLCDTTLPVLIVEASERFKKYPQIGFGGEGTIYQYDEATVFKLFDWIDNSETLHKKFQKIEKLAQLEDDAFCFPMGLVGYADRKKEGYYTSLVHAMDGCADFSDLHFLHNQKKILEYLIKADAAIQRIHRRGVILGDIRGSNIMLDKDGNPKFVDTDNYAYQEYGFDVADVRTKWLEECFQRYFSPRDSDIYLYSMLAIQSLIEGTLLSVRQSDAYFRALIRFLNVSKEVKDGLRMIFSDAMHKPYIGPILEKINPEEKLISKENVYKLNRI